MAQAIPRGAQSPESTDRVLEQLLTAFADAWNRHDVDALMSMMTPDGVFEASSGNDVDGERHEGYQAVRAAYAAVFAQYPDAHWGQARHFVKGDRGVSEWTFTGTRTDGTRVEVTGCDLFTFQNGKIAVKNSFRKNRGTGLALVPGVSLSEPFGIRGARSAPHGRSRTPRQTAGTSPRRDDDGRPRHVAGDVRRMRHAVWENERP